MKLTLTFLEDGVLIEVEGNVDHPLLYLAAAEVLNQAVQDWFISPYPIEGEKMETDHVHHPHHTTPLTNSVEREPGQPGTTQRQ